MIMVAHLLLHPKAFDPKSRYQHSLLLQLPTQVYMACLFAMLELLLNFQHCLYTRWLVPRQQARQQRQETAAGLAESDKSSNQLQLTPQPQPEPVSHPNADRQHETSNKCNCLSFFIDRRTDHSSQLASDLPGAQHMRALSSGLQQVFTPTNISCAFIHCRATFVTWSKRLLSPELDHLSPL